MTQIQIPDDAAAALHHRAAEQGLTLEGWLTKLAGIDAAQPLRERRHRLADLIAQCDIDAPVSREDLEWLDSPNVGAEKL